MTEFFKEDIFTIKTKTTKKKKGIWLNLVLFILTFFTTILAGMWWITGSFGPYEISELHKALPYSFSIMFILGVHEFGHYFAARYHKVDSTLPYFIPLPFLPQFFINFGTMGAVIKTRSAVKNNKAMFDIGVAGPIAGFFASLIVLIYGFTNLPGVEYILNIHPDYFSQASNENALVLQFGDTLLFSFLRNVLTTSKDFVPPMTEVYHYPYLCVGLFGMFVTAMNMIPVGQLDGGHIIYSMFGDKKHQMIANISLAVLGVLGIAGIMNNFFGFKIPFGWTGWIFWGLILFFIIKVKHPPVYNFEKLDPFRMFLGYFSIFILIVTFSPNPISVNF